MVETLNFLWALIMIFKSFNSFLGFVSTPSLPIKSGAERGNDSYKIFHEIVGFIFGKIDNFNFKGTEGFEPFESESCKSVFVLNEKDIKVFHFKDIMELFSFVINAGANFLDYISYLITFCCGIFFKSFGLRFEGSFILGGRFPGINDASSVSRGGLGTGLLIYPVFRDEYSTGVCFDTGYSSGVDASTDCEGGDTEEFGYL